MSTIKLDFIEDITHHRMDSPIKNCHTLEYLPEGLHHLAFRLRTEEIRQNREELCPSHMSLCFDPKTYLIACEFHWFANSIVNYARLVALMDITSKNGWMIEHLSDKSVREEVKNHCTEYVRRVLPEIYVWRNKVSAHFASSDPFSTDNMGTLQDSILHPISYTRPYYFASAHTFSRGGEESVIPKWSLTQTFEKLSVRFFPHRNLPEIDRVAV